MVNEKYKEMLNKKNIIRIFSEYAKKRGDEIGYENVFDYSLGNPSVPCPDIYNKSVTDNYNSLDSISLHGYSPTLGIDSVRETVADFLKERYKIPYEKKHIFMTSGAAGAIAHAIRAVTKPGDSVITFSPFFPEYIPYINETGAVLKVCKADEEDFQINFEELLKILDESVSAVLINSPNNPSGAIYSEETMKRLGEILCDAEKRFDHEIFLISDEPYREIVYSGFSVPYPADFYVNQISCYSFSKSLSIPGERIGYIAVNPRAKDSDILAAMCGQISRGIGHNCPDRTAQLGIESVLKDGFKTSDISIYEKNMNILYDELINLGFSVKKPGGTFYIFPKCLEEDSVSFCNRALKYDLILVPSDNFGVEGYFRMAYCIDTEKVLRSLEAFKKLASSYC